MKANLPLIVALLFTVTTCFAQQIEKAESALTNSDLDKDIKASIEKLAASFPNNTQLSIALINADETTYLGIIRQEDVLNFIDNKASIFEIGSISKVFTSLMFSQLIFQQKIGLEDKLVDALPVKISNRPNGTEEVTLKMLANHSSGLPRIPSNLLQVMLMNQNNPYEQYTPEMLETYFANEMALEYEPATKNEYSNLGAGTLGYIISKTANLSYEELLQKSILKPLSMDNTSTLLEKYEEESLVKGLYPNGSETSYWEFTDALVGAGGIKSNILDLEKFVKKNFEDDEVYNLPQSTTYVINDQMHVGLGWHINKRGEQSIHWHNGATGGFKSCLAFDKKSKKAVIVLSNVSAFNNNSANIDRLCFDLLGKI